MNPLLNNPGLAATFEKDFRSLLARLETTLQLATFEPSEPEHIRQLGKLAHTMRGVASMVLVEPLTKVCDDLERLFEVASACILSEPARAQEIFRFANSRFRDITQILADTLRDDGASAEKQQQVFGVAVRERWGGYFYAESERQSGDDIDVEEAAFSLKEEVATPLADVAADFLASLQSPPAHLQTPAPAPLSAPTARLNKPARSARTVRKARASAPAAPAPSLAGAEQIDPDMLGFFLIETTESLEHLEQALLIWERNAGDLEAVHTIFRLVHTMKGAANSIGLLHIGPLLHGIEDILEDLIDGRPTPPHMELAALIFSVVDTVKALAAAAQSGRLSPALELQGRELTAKIKAARADAAVTPARRQAVPVDTAPKAPPVPARSEAPAVETESASTDAATQSIRVDTDRLDMLMKLIGELVINRTRLDKKIADIARLKEELNRCKTRLLSSIGDFQEKYEFSRNRFSRQQGGQGWDEAKLLGRGREGQGPGGDTAGFSELEFDRYDDFNILARSLVEIGTDTSEIIGQLDRFFGSFGEETAQFSKITNSLQDEITRVRMVPLNPLFRRLQRAVHDASAKEAKEVELSTSGGDVHLDKVLIDQVYTPLLHIARNAVSHGIEPAATRADAGKPQAGHVTLHGYQQAGKVVIEVTDDGRGLDLEAIRAEGVARGLLAAHANPPPAELANLIFHPGFSTAKATTDVSGRGIGLDVARQEISKLNGTVEVISRPGEGCTFVVKLPLTLSINQAMILKVGEEIFALPLNFVERAQFCPIHSIQHSGDQEVVRVEDQLVPLVRLHSMFGVVEAATERDGVAVVVRLAEQPYALFVDRILRKQDIVVKSLGAMLGKLPLFSGATLSGEGEVVLIVDLPGLIQNFQRSAGTVVHRPVPAQPAQPVPASACRDVGAPVLIVDDSLSIRKVQEKHVHSLGYKSEMAVDGLDALEKLRGGTFSMVLTDLEMPRIHGFELISEIRRQAALRDLPIVVVTSRDAEKHRLRARELGANDYLIKPFTREQLRECFKRYLEPAAALAAGVV